MKRWIMRAAVVGALLALGGFIVAASGVIPIKASSGHWAVTEWVLRFGMKRSIATHSLFVDVPTDLASPHLALKGAAHYEIGCRSCHGEPGMPLPRLARAMLPQPPELAPRIRESNPKKLFYVVKHGMKFTGMPAWPSQQRDDEVWAMVAFLLKYPELNAEEYRRLARRETPAAALVANGAPTASSSTAVVQSCCRCHGSDGLGRGSEVFPKLAGQGREYLENALLAYAQGKRHSGTMEPIAAGIDREAVRQVAHYYAGLNASRPSPPSPVARNTEAIARGERIALDGIPDRRVPSCIECHGVGGTRRKPEYPILAGQPAGYLQLQLQLFSREQRGGSAYEHLMRPTAKKLTAEEMREVALYFESLVEGKSIPRQAPRDRP